MWLTFVLITSKNSASRPPSRFAVLLFSFVHFPFYSVLFSCLLLTSRSPLICFDTSPMRRLKCLISQMVESAKIWVSDTLLSTYFTPTSRGDFFLFHYICLKLSLASHVESVWIGLPCRYSIQMRCWYMYVSDYKISVLQSFISYSLLHLVTQIDGCKFHTP